MKNSIFAACALGVAALGLAACGETAEAPAAEEESGIPGMTVSNARLVLAPVAGNPAAVYFDLAYDGDKSLAIRKADVEGSDGTMIHEYGEFDFKVQMMEALPIVVNKGDTLEFKPGEKHVMAMKPSADLKPGGTTDVTLTVAGGKTMTFPAEIRAAGEER